MRISTSMMFDTGTQNMQQLQTNLYKLQNQMSTGRRVLTPSDDPVAAAQAVVVSQQQSVNAQFMDNQGNAESQLVSLESNVRNVSDLLILVKERVAEASNENMNNTQRQAIAFDIREKFDQLLGLANSSDAMGNFQFSGFSGNIQPVSVAGTPGNRNISYHGDDGHRQLQVGTGRLMDVSESGSDVFFRIPQGNGQFAYSAGTNSGTGVIGDSSVVTGYNDDTYKLTFTSANAYTLETNGVTGSSLTYTDGADIVLGSGSNQIKINLSGTPVAGDTFTVAPSKNQDVFKTLDNMIKALESNVSASAATKATYKNQMRVIDENIDQAFTNVITIQTSIGARRLEVESLSLAAADRDLQYQTDISKLVDLDYTKAISDMANQKMVLEAAQLSFKQVSQMSLFSYL